MRRVRGFSAKVMAAVAIVLIAFAAVVTLYGRYTGSWAARSILPIPPDSDHLTRETTATEIYDIQQDVYSTSTSFEETRSWFNEFIRMSNNLAELEDEFHSVSIDHPHGLSPEYLLFVVAGNMTRSVPNQTYTYDQIPDCFSVEVFNLKAFSQTKYPQAIQSISIREENTVLFVVQTCWPNW